jgi:hypothetical protein
MDGELDGEFWRAELRAEAQIKSSAYRNGEPLRHARNCIAGPDDGESAPPKEMR